MKKFPKWLFISEQGDGKEKWLSASRNQVDAIEDDGPTQVATYQLVKVNKLSKRVHFDKP